MVHRPTPTPPRGAKRCSTSPKPRSRRSAPRWTLPWSGRLVGFVPNSPAELGDLIQATVDVTKFVAFVAYGFDPVTLRATSPRLYIQDTNLSRVRRGPADRDARPRTHPRGGFAICRGVHSGMGARRSRRLGGGRHRRRRTRAVLARVTTRRVTTSSAPVRRARSCGRTAIRGRSSRRWRGSRHPPRLSICCSARRRTGASGREDLGARSGAGVGRRRVDRRARSGLEARLSGNQFFVGERSSRNLG